VSLPPFPDLLGYRLGYPVDRDAAFELPPGGFGRFGFAFSGYAVTAGYGYRLPALLAGGPGEDR
jgi:hypothetical protein